MTSYLIHRGPDADGVWVGEGIALGHRRLSIIDLSEAGAQPMLSACGRFIVAFNGEIYNHPVLREDLDAESAAPPWRGHSDTETLLAAFAHWGIDETLRRVCGMFALALWDRQARRLFLARDPMGEKPLYWGWAGRSIVFGSELKALRPHADFPKEISRDALSLYLRFGYVPAPHSIHPGVFKLEPGCVLDINGDPPAVPPNSPLRPSERHQNLSIRRYWSLNDGLVAGNQQVLHTDDEALEVLERALRQTVARQMMADVPLGAFLSGGVDSSLIVALMQQQSLRAVKTFTVGFENPSFNEASYAAAVAAHLGTDHTELTVTENEAREAISLLPSLYDEPFGDSSQIPTYFVSKAARAKVTVALSGDAGDELFGGYNRYFWGPRLWNQLSRLPFPLRKALGAMITTMPVSTWDRLGRLLAICVGRDAVSRPGEKLHKLGGRLCDVHSLDDLYRSVVSEWPAANVVVGQTSEPKSLIDDPLPAFLAKDAAGRMMAQDMRTYLPDDILCKIDRAAMGVSLETRVPFLDPDVMAVSTRLPPHMKIRDGQGKWALRQLLYRHVPQNLIDRPKIGFSVPVGEWLRGPIKAWAEELLSDSALTESGLDSDLIREVWMEHLRGRHDFWHRLWIVLVFQAWVIEQK